MVEARGGVDVVVGVITEEVDVIGKIPLNPKLVDGLLNLANLIGFLGKDVDHDGVGVGDCFLADYRQYFLELAYCHFFNAP